MLHVFKVSSPSLVTFLLTFLTLSGEEVHNIQFSSVQSLSRVRLFATSWPVAYQSPPSMGFSRQNTGVGCHFLLQEIFPTQVLNLSLQHYRQMLYSLSHQGSPFLLKREQQNKCPFYHKVSFQVINTHTHTEEVSTTAESVKALSSPPLIGTPKL